MTINWTEQLADQLDWQWQTHLRPRLSGLTDEEYLWEPVPHTWSVRPRGQGVATEVGRGAFIVDFSIPEPSPPPVTTIAWRLAHLLVGVLGVRNARYFAGPAVDFDGYDYPGSASEALTRLDDSYARWISGVRALNDAALAAPCREPGFESDPMGGLVLHINREMLHHSAEVALLRDLYRWRVQPAPLSPG